MAPSRGSIRPSSTTSSTSHGQSHDSHDHDGEKAVSQQSSSALASARRNFNYLVNPSTSANGGRPARFRTRALLRTVRYLGQFIFWRLIRWAKYVAVGSIVAAIGATAIGSVVSGVAWIAAPTTLGASIISASIWGVGKYIARKAHKKWKREGGDVGQAKREYERDYGPELQKEGTMGMEMGPRAMPW